MRKGIYKYKKVNEKPDDTAAHNGGIIILKVYETKTAYTLKLVKNTLTRCPLYITQMFEFSNKVKIDKNTGIHAVRFGENGFTLYPFRTGRSFSFRRIG